MDLKFIDTHAHYDDSRYDADREELFESMARNGVYMILNAASDIKAAQKGISLAEKYPFIYAAVGVHPHYTKNMTDRHLDRLRELAAHKKVVAYGETGLDFYHNHSDKQSQRFWFAKQLELSIELDLPVIIHSRDASEEVYAALKNSGINKGVIHCYSGSAAMARKYTKLGFHIGIGGVITFKNAKKLVDVVYETDISKLLLETDCPYLSPEPHRGERNNSGNIRYIAEKIAGIKNMTVFDVCEQTTKNAAALFGMSL
jgi:TatD DNase family protein